VGSVGEASALLYYLEHYGPMVRQPMALLSVAPALRFTRTPLCVAALPRLRQALLAVLGSAAGVAAYLM
jgi:hypothetical protein